MVLEKELSSPVILSRIHAIDVPSGSTNKSTERWSGLSPSR
jgi:hypothetical protein